MFIALYTQRLCAQTPLIHNKYGFGHVVLRHGDPRWVAGTNRHPRAAPRSGCLGGTCAFPFAGRHVYARLLRRLYARGGVVHLAALQREQHRDRVSPREAVDRDRLNSHWSSRDGDSGWQRHQLSRSSRGGHCAAFACGVRSVVRIAFASGGRCAAFACGVRSVVRIAFASGGCCAAFACGTRSKRRALRGDRHEPFLFDSARGKIRGSVSCIRFTSRQGSFSSSLRMYTLLSFSV